MILRFLNFSNCWICWDFQKEKMMMDPFKN